MPITRQTNKRLTRKGLLFWYDTGPKKAIIQNIESMFKSYFTIAIRHLRKNMTISVINIAGLTIGMAVTILIGLWVWNELSFDTYYKNFKSIAQVYRKETVKGESYIAENNNHFPIPLADELRKSYGNYFQRVALASGSDEHVVSYDNRPFSRAGMYVEASFTDIFNLKILSGRPDLREANSILLASSLAHSLFGGEDATGKTIQLDNKTNATVTGVFEDIPRNARFSDQSFFCPLSLLISTDDNVRVNQNNWENSSFELFVQAAKGTGMDQISRAVSKAYWAKVKNSQADASASVALFLYPMKEWHLRSNWENGVQTGGRIQLVWLFGIIGIFVLLLACINFMNLSTARSEKRAKEVGIRKTLGSLRGQLVKQFLVESFSTIFIAFGFSVLLVNGCLDNFNRIAEKDIHFPFAYPLFWVITLTFLILTALLAGSYPAFYLSSFKPVKVLKGSFRAGRFASLLRKVTLGIQFTVSIILMAGTLIVYRQVQYAQKRPIGYDKQGLIRIKMNSPSLYGKYEVLQHELLQSGAAIGYAQSTSTTTGSTTFFSDDFEWPGKDPNLPKKAFGLVGVTADFGKTVGWEFISGRDFSKDLATDSAALILNETAARNMGLLNTVGETIRWRGKAYRVDGIIRNMITESPYEPVQQAIFGLIPNVGPYIVIRLNPSLSANEAISRIEPIFGKYDPSGPFDYSFLDEEFGRKFSAERRIGALTSIFSVLAIIISCLGIFGLSIFVAEQRNKEIGLRKVLGASVVSLWGLLIREFVAIVAVSFLIATPVTYTLMDHWLQQYNYRTDIAWWMFLVSGCAVLSVTVTTVSFQTIKAASENPLKALRQE